MIKVICVKCKKELDKAGALLFSPPWKPDVEITTKQHLCCECYEKIHNFIFNGANLILTASGLNVYGDPVKNVTVSQVWYHCHGMPNQKMTCEVVLDVTPC
jgi:hypothetical protein